MSKFKVGDRVRWIEETDSYMTRNKEYVVVGFADIPEDIIFIVKDNGYRGSFWTSRFELVSSAPDVTSEQKEVKNFCYFCAKQYTEECKAVKTQSLSGCTNIKFRNTTFEKTMCNHNKTGACTVVNSSCWQSKLSAEAVSTQEKPVPEKNPAPKKNPLAVGFCKHPDCHTTAIDGTDYCYKHTGIPLTGKDLARGDEYTACHSCHQLFTETFDLDGNTYCGDCFGLLKSDKPNPVLIKHANEIVRATQWNKYLMGGV